MDSSIESAIGSNVLTPYREKNKYAQTVGSPSFQLQQIPVKPELYVETRLASTIEDLSVDFASEPLGAAVKDEIIKSVNSTTQALQTSEYKYTSDYYDLKTLDLQLDLVARNSRVLTFSPRVREYFVERECKLTVALFDSKISSKDDRLTLSKVDKPSLHDQFYMSTTKGILSDDLVKLSFEYENSLEERFEPFKGSQYDLIFHEESSYQRTGNINARDYSYDPSFFEPALKSLGNLASGGTMIIKLESFGFRLIADLVYLYKFVFQEVTMCKPATSNACSLEHYLVGIGFNSTSYKMLVQNIDAVLSAVQSESRLYSFLSNLDKSDYQAQNFKNWLMRTNNDIGLAIAINLSHALVAATDYSKGFKEGHSPYVLDMVSYRESLGYLGRSTLQSLPSVEFSEDVKEDGGLISSLTETGQNNVSSLSLDVPMSPKPRVNTTLYISLNLIVNSLIDDQQWLPFFHKIGSLINKVKVTQKTITEQKLELKYAVRNWLGILYANGDLDKLVDYSSSVMIKQEAHLSRIMEFANQIVVQDVFGVNPPGDAQYWRTVIGNYLSMIYQILINVKGQPDFKFLADAMFKITPIDNARYRIAYCQNGISGMLSHKNEPSVIGEYELANLLTPGELDRMEDFQQIVDHLAIPNSPFVLRLVDHCCLPIYLSGYNNELAIPDVYFKYKPDVELYANVVNRHAPIWCSANPGDVEFGSSGTFDQFMSIDNPYWKNEDSKLLIAFPPMHRSVIGNTAQLCLRILKNLSDQEKSCAIIIVYPQDFKELIDDTFEDLGDLIVSKSQVVTTYQPFTGHTHSTFLNMLGVKTANSNFNF